MTKPAPMPPRAAAYLEIASMRERIFTMMFERTGNAQKAVDEAYVAMCFIEEGDASMAEEARANDPEAARDSVPESEPSRRVRAPMAVEISADGIKLGHNHYSKEQIEALKGLWASENSTVDQIEKCLGVSWMTAKSVAHRLNLGQRGKRPNHRGGAGAVDNTGAINLDDAIDWFESRVDGRPVIPSEKYLGSFELGEGSGAVVTRNALVAEINALRRREGLEAFTIRLNGA